jgi:hypothetical protein
LRPWLPLVTVANPAALAYLAVGASPVPRLLVEESRWREDVADLVTDASIVFVRVGEASAGVVAELGMLDELARHDATILVYTSSDETQVVMEKMAALIGAVWRPRHPDRRAQALLARFPRTVTDAEIAEAAGGPGTDGAGLAALPAFGDLLADIAAVKAVPMYVRLGRRRSRPDEIHAKVTAPRGEGRDRLIRADVWVKKDAASCDLGVFDLSGSGLPDHEL